MIHEDEGFLRVEFKVMTKVIMDIAPGIPISTVMNRLDTQFCCYHDNADIVRTDIIGWAQLT